MLPNDVYSELCWMLEYAQSERLYKLWKLAVPDEVDAKVLTGLKCSKAPHSDPKTVAEVAAVAGLSEEETNTRLHSLLKRALCAKVGAGLWAFGAYGLGCVEDVTDGISYSTCMQYYDPKTGKLTDPSKQELIDALNDFLDVEWYHSQRPDELVHARWLLISGLKPTVVPQICAIEKSGLADADLPNPMVWNIRAQMKAFKEAYVTSCPCRFRNGRIDDFPMMTCASFAMDPRTLARVEGEVEVGNRVKLPADEYAEIQRKAERMGLIHTCGACVCEETCCNILKPLKDLYTIKEGLLPSAFKATKKPSAECVGCGICMKNCRFEAITIHKGKAVVDESKCYGCGACVTMCPHDVNVLKYAGQ